MDYEKKYKEALERAKLSRLQLLDIGEEATEIEHIFPELKESEDEKIRKEIISIVKSYRENCITEGNHRFDDCLAWIEKQCEPQDKGEISDGYHTFNELYYYRMLYNAAFFNILPKEWVHKSKRHNDGEECFGGGWFIVMANLPTGQISNHYELKDWDLFQIPEKEVADKWDGHTPQEAADRLHKYLLKKQCEQEELYIRFGEIPTDEKSKIYNGEIEVGTENGVSVYHAFKTHEGDIVLGLSLPITKTTLYTQQHLIEYSDRPCYLVKGDYVGKDTDGQPLINNVSIIKKIDIYRVKEEKQSEKKSNKIEPRFKVGDWIYHNKVGVYPILITDYDEELGYQTECLSTKTYFRKEFVEKEYHLWTIQDANDGDVIAIGDEYFLFKKKKENSSPVVYISHCFADSAGAFRVTNGRDCGEFLSIENGIKACPATKEQRDLLFQKMKEEGYEWDADKKELKEIEQNLD